MTSTRRCVRAVALVAGALLLGGCLAFVPVGGGELGVGTSGGGVTIDADGIDGPVGVTGGGGGGGGGGGDGDDRGRGVGHDHAPVARALVPSLPATAVPVPDEPATGPLMAKPVAAGWVTSRFGPRHGRRHNGVDYAAPRGTAVQAAGDGVVEEIRHSASYGNYVRIRHGRALESAYAHLSAFAAGLSEGETVHRGQVIGAVGATGRASGPHLHYEVISGGTFVDPMLVGH